MPNIVTHMIISEAVAPQASPDFRLASAMPDFVGMARDFRGSQTTVRELSQNPLLKEGIALHIATDGVFDQLPLSRQLISDARADMEAMGLPRGAVRVCADVGTEILLDGVMMGIGNNPTYNKVSGYIVRGESVLDTIEDIELVSLIRDYFATNRPNKYRDPEAVASMLQYRLSCRKNGKLQFDEDLIPDVAEAFKKQQKRLRRIGQKLIDETIDGLKASRAN